MLVTALTLALVAAFVGFIFLLGYSQGKHVEKRRVKRRTLKTEWIARECIRRWSPWDKDESEHYAALAADYDQEMKP